MDLNEKEKVLLDTLESKLNEKASSYSAAVETVKAGLTEVREKDMKALETLLVKRMDELEALAKAAKPAERLGLKEQVAKELGKDEVMRSIKSKQVVDLEFKEASDMSFAGTSSGQPGRIEFAPGIGFNLLNGIMLANLLPEYPCNSNTVYYIDATSPQGGPDFINDSETAPQWSATITQNAAPIKDVSVYSAYSNNMMDDIDNFSAYINDHLQQLLIRKYDEKLYNGAASGTDEFNGLTYYAQTFSLPDASLKTTSPNLRDVLNAACAQVENNKGKANFVLLNPIDFRALKNIKDTTGQYAMPWDLSPLMMIDGLAVIANPAVTNDNFLVGDFTKAAQYVRQSLRLTIDPYTFSTKNAIRVTLTKRATLIVHAGDAYNFVKGVISTAKTALTAE